MSSVFADSAGNIKDPKERVIALATVVASDTQIEQINERCNRLKNKVAEWGIDTSQKRFEFHSYEVLQPSGVWRTLSQDKRIAVAKAINQTISGLKLPFAMVVIDKRYGGDEGIDRFHEYTTNCRKEVLSQIGEEGRRSLELLIQKLPKKKGFGQLGDITGLLFGLTTGLMHSEGFRDEAKLVADKQFVKQIEGWKLLFQIQARGWPMVAGLGLFPSWPINDQPNWYLGNTVEEMESHESYGVQLADFVAYTTKRIREEPLDLARQVAIVDEHNLIPFKGYRGIYLTVSHKASRRFVYRRQS